VDYLERVNRAIDYITNHLSASLKLEDVARVAHFSPFHFHRIFRAIAGETVHDFVKRLRCERALYLIAHSDGRTLTEIALACGFGSSSDFSRSFRQHFGVAPRAFDVDALRRSRRDEMARAMSGQTRLEILPSGANPDNFVAHLRRLPARRVAYLRVFKPYEGGRAMAATAQLVTWARERGLAGGQWLGYQWDDPEIVPLDRCRYDIGVEIPESVRLDAGISETRFAPMTVAEIDIAGAVDLELRALDWLFTTWLPHSGFEPDDQPCFEAFNGEPFADGSGHYSLRVQLPVIDGTGSP
jgi:AraC family transcriptional regulator